MTNIRTGFKGALNIITLLLLFCIPGTGILFGWFYMDRKNFVHVLAGNIWFGKYLRELRRRYATGEE